MKSRSLTRYYILKMLSTYNRSTEEITHNIPEVGESHVMRLLQVMSEDGLCEIVDHVKRDPGAPGRPMRIYRICPDGVDFVQEEEANMRKIGDLADE